MKKLLLSLAVLTGCGGSATIQCPNARWRLVKLEATTISCDDVAERTEEARSFLLAAGRATQKELDDGMRSHDLTVRAVAAWHGPDGLVDGFTKEGLVEVDWSAGSMGHELEHVVDNERGRNLFIWDDAHGGWTEDGSWALGELFAHEVWEERQDLTTYAADTKNPCAPWTFTPSEVKGLEAAGHDVGEWLNLAKYNGCK